MGREIEAVSRTAIPGATTSRTCKHIMVYTYRYLHITKSSHMQHQHSYSGSEDYTANLAHMHPLLQQAAEERYNTWSLCAINKFEALINSFMGNIFPTIWSWFLYLLMHTLVAQAVAPQHSKWCPTMTNPNCLRGLKPLSSKRLSAMHQLWASYR